MSAKQEKRRRQYEREAYIERLYTWRDNEPPKLRFISWLIWKSNKPTPTKGV